DAVRPQREVISFRVVLNPATKLWFAEPIGRFDVLPVLPQDPVLVGITATEDEPFAVTLPSQKVARGISRDRKSIPGDEASATSPQNDSESAPEDVAEGAGAGFLIAPPERWRWTDVAMPKGFEHAVAAVVGKGGESGRTHPFVAWTSDDAEWSLSRLTGEGWSTSVLPLDAGVRPIGIVESEGGILLASHVDGSEDGVSLDYVRLVADQDPTMLRLAQVPADRVASPLAVVGTSMGPWLLDIEENEIRILPIDPLSGALGASVRPVDETGEFSLLHYPLTGIAMVSSLIAALLLRPLIERAPKEPVAGLRPLAIPRRLAALCIDFIPGAMITVLVFEIDPGQFVESFRTGDPETALPAVFAIFVTAIIAGLAEVLFARSMGKALVGGQVVALDGSPASLVQRGLRATLKLVVLLLPPLGFLVLIDPVGRGMSELLSRTCVAARPASEVPQTGPDKGDSSSSSVDG
ncbi:MAG: RDD family protein, partial [Phycisphaerales bacterium]|nr:RDD family protein [Phycisphaerales bacterium]